MIIHVLKQWQSYLVLLCSGILHMVLFRYTSALVVAISLVAFFISYGVLFWFRYRKDDRVWLYIGGGVSVLIGSFGLLFLAEVHAQKIWLAVLHSLVFAWYMYVPSQLTAQLAHEFKPWRRILTILMTYGLFGMVSSVYGLSLFLQFKTFLWSGVYIGVVSGALAYVILRLYYQPKAGLREWALACGVAYLEYAIALSYTSFGYFSLGLLFTWVWYVLLVLLRFHVSQGGIDWSKQRVFLLSNIAFFICILYTTRWL